MKEIQDKNEKALWKKLNALIKKIRDPSLTKSGERTIQAIKDAMVDVKFLKRIEKVRQYYKNADSSVGDWWEVEKNVDAMVNKIAKDFKITDVPFGPLAQIVRLEKNEDLFSQKNLSLANQCKLIHNWMNIYFYLRSNKTINYSKEQKYEDSTFPISIKISADARPKDTKDFIEAHWHTIKLVQLTFRQDSNKALRERRNRERDEFILEERKRDQKYEDIVEAIENDQRFEGLAINIKIAQEVVRKSKKRSKNPR